MTLRSVERDYSLSPPFLENTTEQDILNKITSVVSQMKALSYLLQLKLISGLGRPGDYLASFPLSHVHRGPQCTLWAQNELQPRSSLLNTRLESSFGRSPTLSWMLEVKDEQNMVHVPDGQARKTPKWPVCVSK